MYEVVARLDKQYRVVIPSVIRHLIGDPRPGDVVKIIVVEKVAPKDKTNALSHPILSEDALTA
jgi:bifunctional DNA-binding transcriptional regulator/antitoxin component of YhaV-PrlF toxin-antitoxin module